MTLPEELCDLPLESLNVSSNKLHSLPAAIENMTVLRELVRRALASLGKTDAPYALFHFVAELSMPL